MRAIEPAATGYVERDGVKLFWEEFGAGEPTVVLLPTWSIVDSRHWKFQVPYLARHHRVITFDGRGCGLSDRPRGAAAYTHLEFAADTLAVLDATGVDRAVLVAYSCGTLWAVQVAADHPDRVLGLAAISPAVSLTPMHVERTVHPFDEPVESTEGWATYNRHHWERDYAGFVSFFVGKWFIEPHSTKAVEDCVGWGLEIEPATLVDAHDGLDACGRESMRTVCARRAPAGARHPRRRGRHPALRRWGRPRRGDRRLARHGHRRRPRAALPRPGPRQPVVARVHRRTVRPHGGAVMRAMEPAAAGYVERDGVELYWEEFGEGEPTIALLPTWSIAHSRHWKFQVPYLARHHRVITFDGRGCGLSDRPAEPSAYGYLEYAADALAVLDATGTDRAVLAGLSLGAVWSLVLAADEPKRVLGVVCLGPALRLAPWPAEREEYGFDDRLATTDGWAKYNRHHWLEGGYGDFLAFFFDRFFPEPHSTKQIEDFTNWALEIDPSTLVTVEDGLFARRARVVSGALRTGRCARARDPRRPRRDGAVRRWTHAGRAHRWGARDRRPVAGTVCWRAIP